MKHLSLSQRLLITVSIVLTIFLGLTAISINNAFQASYDVSDQRQLRNHLYMLLTAAEFTEKGDIIMPSEFAEPAFSTPNSGLYAQMANQHGIVWQSPSTLGQDLAFPIHFSPPYEQFSISPYQDSDLLNFAYSVVWVNTLGQEFEYTIHVSEDRTTSQQEKAEFSLHLWYWLGSAGFALLLIQVLVLRWSLKPLSEVAQNLSAIESGETSRLSQNYPAELNQLTRNINTLLDHEQSRRLRYKHALADLAHSIKTPLAVLRTELESDKTMTSFTSYEQLKRVTNLIDYQLQRAATEGSTSLQAPINIAYLVEKIVNSLDKVYHDKTIQHDIEIEPQLRVNADEGDMYELLGNLLENAYKYCDQRVITIITTSNDHILIQIDDDGEGIPKSAQADILKRGKRIDTQTEGQGLGLAIVSNILEAYQGTIGLGETPLGGARFVITLPRRLT